jgi:hypothetical protein
MQRPVPPGKQLSRRRDPQTLKWLNATGLACGCCNISLSVCMLVSNLSSP